MVREVKKRYNVKQVAICGESGDVQGQTVDSWKERLPEIVRGYRKEDVWNMEETGVFLEGITESWLCTVGNGLQGRQEEQAASHNGFFFCFAAGTKETPVAIWKPENPSCLKWFDKAVLRVDYFSQKKALMTGEIKESLLTKINHQLCRNNSSILLLMDNAGCHPEYLRAKFSNIKVSFLPANTTSKLQPLYLGIIQNFMVHYRQHFLRYVLSRSLAIAKGINTPYFY